MENASHNPHHAPQPSHEYDQQHTAPIQKESFFGEIFRFALIALLVVLPIRLFIAQPFIVSGASMEDTFETGEYLIIDQVTYRFHEPERGDVIVFRYPNDPSKYFIKRIIGIPGDSITVRGDTTTISNASLSTDIVIDEPYAQADNTGGAPITKDLGMTEYFVMGDNRDASSDSRTWGVLPEDNIVGRVFVRLFPITQISLLPGEFDITAQLIKADRQ